MKVEERSVEIAGRPFAITGNDEYARQLSGPFDPELVGLLALLCDKDCRALDVGANLGLVTLALSEICSEGRVVALEPVPTTFELLQKNIAKAGAKNVDAFNFALGSKPASLPMQGAPNDFSGAFVADGYQLDRGHFTTVVEVKALDETFSDLSLDRLDFMKVDVEGFELEVLEGAQHILQTRRPLVLLEMNHWCLNVFRRVSMPEFRERLMSIFPCLYAVEGTTFLDFSNPENAHHVYHEHLTKFKFMNLVAGFERETILSRLAFLSRCHHWFVEANALKGQLAAMRQDLNTARADLNTAATERQALQLQVRSLQEERDALAFSVQQMAGSKSWKLTAPLRAINDRIAS